jgi:6-pyruvoyltetrahydropterin/6-carboxytetrahydropterin synthase
MFELTIAGDIAAAHFLRGYDGPCKNLHGHTWKMEATIESNQLNEIGLVVDFRDMKKKLKEFLMHLDHVCLNDLPYFKEVNPSTENLAKYVYQEFSKACRPFKLKRVRVWESEGSSITYYE